MTIWLKQSTAADVVVGPFVDDTDGKTVETSLTIGQADCQLSKNGAAVAQKNDATSASHLGGGHYKIPLNTTDTNTLGRLRLYVNEGGALPVWVDFMVVPANVWDSLFGGDVLQVHAIEIANNLITGNALDATAAAEIADAVWDEDLGAHGTAGSAGKHLDDAADGDYIGGSATAAEAARHGYLGIAYGQAVTGTLTTTAFTTDLTEATNNHYNGRTITFIEGPLAGQQRTIADYDGATKTITVAAMTDAPANGNKFFIA